MGAFSANSNQMREVAGDVSVKEKSYLNKIDEIQNQINHLGQMWNSPAYDEFKKMFEAKLPSLREGDQLMQQFQTKLVDAADSFDQAQSNIMNNFM